MGSAATLAVDRALDAHEASTPATPPDEDEERERLRVLSARDAIATFRLARESLEPDRARLFRWRAVAVIAEVEDEDVRAVLAVELGADAPALVCACGRRFDTREDLDAHERERCRGEPTNEAPGCSIVKRWRRRGCTRTARLDAGHLPASR